MVTLSEKNPKKGIYTNYRKMKGRPLVYLFVLLVLVVMILWFIQPGRKGSSGPDGQPPSTGEPAFVKEGELTFLKPDSTVVVTIDIEIADDDLQREQGLMYRRQMEMSTGMLFIFGEEEPRSFWMKNTHLPLDIIYLSAGKQIVSIHENTPPFSEQSIPSRLPAQYVVEVVAGFTALYNIKPGDLITFRR